MQKNKINVNYTPKFPNSSKFENKSKSYIVTTNEKTCILCKGSHDIYSCEEFKKLSPLKRLYKAKELELCTNCLGTKHRPSNCTSIPCRKCNRRHHTYLHIDQALNTTTISPIHEQKTTKTTNNSQTTEASKVHIVQSKINQSIYSLLPTAIVYIYDASGNKHEARAYLDSCSQANLITTDLCKRLSLSKGGQGTLSGIEHFHTPVQKTTVKIQSRTTDFNKIITCLVLDEIDSSTPSSLFKSTDFNIPHGIKLADPEFDRPRAIDLLIGVGSFYELLCVGQIKGQMGDPLYQKTLLGWVVAGDVLLNNDKSIKSSKNFMIKNNELSNQLKQFWEIENGILETREHIKLDPAEKHFKETIKRDETGRFVINIPFKPEVLAQLGSSFEIALKRLYSLEKKLSRNPDLKTKYDDFMTEYERLGHMTKIPMPSHDELEYYFPHHAVIKDSSTSTKLRVVFDGSAKTTTGISINDAQYTGVEIQNDLFSIVLRFRHHTFVLSADIVKMYRQIYVTPSQRPLQRVLYRKNFLDPVGAYELNTLTQGTGSGSFTAKSCLRQIGDDCKTEEPFISQIIIDDFYMDDLLSGAESIEEAMKIRKKLPQILGSYGFELCKWASNDARLIKNDANQENVPLQGDKDPKTLGLIWDPCKDILKYIVNSTEKKRFTKRLILSIISQIYDPLGLVGPAIIPAKIIMQKLWSLNFAWDESLPQELNTTWEEVYHEINAINTITIDRHVSVSDAISIEYHGFCDSSEKAYGACIYACTISKHGKRTCKLFCAKSKVAPLKATSIPRLELQSALLLAQLAHKVSLACRIPKTHFYYWTDSMVSLTWIKAPSAKWKTFVANRTAEIHELTNDNWFHVQSGDNPADLISRGLTASALQSSTLWWNGPQWLSKNRDDWLKTDIKLEYEAPEERTRIFMAKVNEERLETTQNDSKTFDLFNRYSTLTRLTRVTAYILKFFENCKKRNHHTKIQLIYPNLTQTEIHHATQSLIKLAQYDTFAHDIKTLKEGKFLHAILLKQLNPFLDPYGIMRVGGRLEKANIHYDKKHPIILHNDHKFTRVIIYNEHIKHLHGGCQTVLYSLRETYWILRGRSAVRNVLNKCIKCFRVRPRTTPNYMGNLPSNRLIAARAFLNCGVDYAGPFLIREKSRCRVTVKAYMCIFVCFSTKAVHIELASDLTTDAFINCLKRFTSRRGLCKNINSDNGTNFVGANNELLELKKLLQDNNFKNSVVNFCSTKNISWHFIPGHAPHFGGLWEGAVKSAKYHLKRVIGETRLTFEELYTVLTQVEACLNSRPISPLSNDPNDLTPLTPGHFLIGDSLLAIPQEDIRATKVNRLNRYQHLQQMLQHFWQRWSKEYLPQLQCRLKWNETSTTSIKPGCMVLINEDNTPPLQWPLGRVIDTHPGSDGIIRVVSIQGSRSIIKRPTNKICILPIDEYSK